MIDFHTLPAPADVDVRTLLPQQPPFVMVDTLVHFGERTTTCALTVKPDNLFCDEGCFSPAGITESIAQTCAVRLGFYNKYVLHQAVQIGYIGAIRDLTFHRLPRVGERLDTTVTICEEVMGMTLAEAIVEVDGERIAEAWFKIALQP